MISPCRLLLPLIALLGAAGAPAPAAAADSAPPPDPRNFIYSGAGELEAHRALWERPDIAGVQLIYNWRALEPEKGVYDFSAIEADLATLTPAGKKLFAQIQDRFFSAKARNLPDYILTDPQYAGGLARQYDNAGEGKPVGHGWTAKQWNPALRARFQALLAALGARFDGRLYGINLPETAYDRVEGVSDDDFTCDSYFDAALDNMKAARAAFAKSSVVQYINFWPCEWDNDHRYMERAFALAAEQGIGVGGPDIIPWRKGQMKNAYPFLHRYRGQLPLVAMAVQEPTLTYRNPKTGKPFTRDEFIAFARDYLGVGIIFWSTETPWLQGG